MKLDSNFKLLVFEHDEMPVPYMDEQPTFDLEKVQLQFDLRNDLQQLLVAGNIMYIVCSKVLFRIDLDNPSAPSQIPIPSTTDGLKISNCWVSPNGMFFILKLGSFSLFHLHMRYKRFKFLPRFKSHDVQHIAFSDSNNEFASGDFLFITKSKTIYASSIKYHEQGLHDNKRDDKYVKQVFRSSDNIRRVAISSQRGQIYVSTEREFMTWNCSDISLDGFLMSLGLYPDYLVQLPQDDSLLFLLTNSTIYVVGRSNFEIYTNDAELSVLRGKRLNILKGVLECSNTLIGSVHHLIFLSASQNEIEIISKLAPNNSIRKLIKNFLHPQEIALGIISDPSGGTYWLYTCNGIYEIVIGNEIATVWYDLYKMGKYEEALVSLDGQGGQSTEDKRNIILVRQGYEFLREGENGLLPKDSSQALMLQCEGARRLAQLREPLERVCLTLFNSQESNYEDVLIQNKVRLEYLLEKLKIWKKNHKPSVSGKLLTSWIARTYLRLIQLIGDELSRATEIIGHKLAREENISCRKSRLVGERASLQLSLDEFLRTNHSIIDTKIMYDMAARMDSFDVLVSFANMKGDLDFILNHYIELGLWAKALETLRKLYDRDSHQGVRAVQATSSVLLMNYSDQTIASWLQLADFDYEVVLPAILSYNRAHIGVPLTQNPTIMFFLKILIEKSFKSFILSNYYLSLLITHCREDESDEITELLDHFLRNYGKTTFPTHQQNDPLYDKNLILRLCLKHQRFEAAISVLTNDLQLYEAALMLALQHDMTAKAETIIQSFEKACCQNWNKLNDQKLSLESNSDFHGIVLYGEASYAPRRKMWLMYAKHLIRDACGRDLVGLAAARTTLARRKEEGRHGQSDSHAPNNTQLPSKRYHTDQMAEDVHEVDKLSRVLNHLLRVTSEICSPAVITLRDLLPLLPEHITLTNLKEEIVNSLDSHNNRMNQLALDMQESAEIVDKLNVQIRQSEANSVAGSLYSTIEVGEVCDLCADPIVAKSFIAFRNCHHTFHKDCTVRYYLQLKGDYRFKKILKRYKDLAPDVNTRGIEQMLLDECLLCNESNYNGVDEPILDGEQTKSWAI